MFDELLNVELVRGTLDSKGIRTIWLINQLGLPRSTGYILFRHGLLPQDRTVRGSVLKNIAKLLGLDQRQLIVPPVRPRITA